MELWQCEGCGYVYDSAKGDFIGGVGTGTLFRRLSKEWVCPVCGLGKESFTKMVEDGDSFA